MLHPVLDRIRRDLLCISINVQYTLFIFKAPIRKMCMAKVEKKKQNQVKPIAFHQRKCQNASTGGPCDKRWKLSLVIKAARRL